MNAGIRFLCKNEYSLREGAKSHVKMVESDS